MILTVLLAGHLCRTWRLISLSKLDASIGVEMIEDGLLLRDIEGIHPLLICHLLFVLKQEDINKIRVLWEAYSYAACVTLTFIEIWKVVALEERPEASVGLGKESVQG